MNEEVINLGGGDMHMKEALNDKNNPEIVLNQN